MNKTLEFGRAVRMFAVITLSLATASVARATLLPGDSCVGSSCPGGLIRGSSPETSAPVFSYTITENFGIPFALTNPSDGSSVNVVAGDVLIYDNAGGTMLSDLLRFPDNGSGKATEAILYSADETGAGGIPVGRQSTVVSIKEMMGPSTLYKSNDQGEVDYTVESVGPAVPEPSTLSLFGLAGLLVIMTMTLRHRTLALCLMKKRG